MTKSNLNIKYKRKYYQKRKNIYIHNIVEYYRLKHNIHDLITYTTWHDAHYCAHHHDHRTEHAASESKPNIRDEHGRAHS